MKHATRPAPILLAGALFATALAGCSRSEPEAPPVENVAPEEVEPVAPVPVESPVPLDTATPANVTADLPPEEAAQPDEQMLDDASATGMTARAQRGDGAAQDAPAEPAEQR